MNNKTRILKRPPISKEVSVPDPPLKTDELIDFLERSYKKNVKGQSDVLQNLLPILLFVQEALNRDDIADDLIVRFKDHDTNYCTTTDAVGELMRMLSERIYEAWNETDEAALAVSSTVKRYRESQCKVASA